MLDGKFERIVVEALEHTGGPSITVAAVEHGMIAFAGAFGSDRLAPRRTACVDTIYNIASVTKQFTAACILLLAEANSLTLDDPVATYFPDLPSGGAITIRHLLTHTSGYRDFYPLSYPDGDKLVAARPQDIVERYTQLPLQFTPGSASSYSNTGYHILGRIVEFVSGMPFGDFLAARILRPAGMNASFFNDPPTITSMHAIGYARFALGRVREAPAEQAGWVYSAGALASTVGDLATWCIALLDERVLKGETFAHMIAPYTLADGTACPAALGWGVETRGSHALIQHSGGLAGFASHIIAEPSTCSAVIVLCNGSHVQTGMLAARLFEVLVPGATAPVPAPVSPTLDLATTRRWIASFQRGGVDREALTEPMNAFLTDDRLSDAREGLGAVGEVAAVHQLAGGERGGMAWAKLRTTFENGVADIVVRETDDGKLAEFNAFPIP